MSSLAIPTAVASSPRSPTPDTILEDDDGAEITIPSTWRTSAITRENNTQTDSHPSVNQFTQTNPTQTISTQTDSHSSVPLDPAAPLPPSLSSFLLSVAPLIEQQLEANRLSHAFDDYQVNWEQERDGFQELFSLINQANQKEAEKGMGEKTRNEYDEQEGDSSSSEFTVATSCSSVSWNCNGSIIACAYASHFHSGWCSHRSSLSSWNIMRRQLDPLKPDLTFELHSCLQVVQFHPTLPTIVAGGMFNGEIRVWDLALAGSGNTGASATATATAASPPPSTTSAATSPPPPSSGPIADDPLLCTSRTDDLFHREPISSLVWIPNYYNRSTYSLVSSSTDGKILIWSPIVTTDSSSSSSSSSSPLSLISLSLSTPSEGLLLCPSSLYTGSGNGPLKNRFPVIGATACGFSIDGATFVVATEGGGLVRGLIPSAMNAAGAAGGGGGGAAAGKKRGGYVKVGEFKWARDAYKLVEVSNARFEVKKLVESYASSHKLAAIEVSHVFACRPSASSLYPSAANFAYTSHMGPVYRVDYSPFHRNLFLSVASDGLVRMYNSLRRTPIMTLEINGNGSGGGTATGTGTGNEGGGERGGKRRESGGGGGGSNGGETTLTDVCWSTGRPLVFAVSDASGRVYVYDLLESMLTPVVTIDTNNSSSTGAQGGSAPRDVLSGVGRVGVVGLSFNPRDASLLSSCDMSGRVQIWQLSPRLAVLQKNETQMLEQIGDMAADV